MDNLTHTLIGLVEGHAATRLLARHDAKRAEKLRVPFCFLGAVANNFPDLDSFTLTWLTPGRLGRMLHHRGYTHTIGGVPFEAALILGLAALWFSRRKKRAQKPDRLDWWLLTTLVIVGLLSHIAADWLNSYGVHPFWPVSAAWHYGDTLFIVEPSLWIVTTPFLYYESRSRWARGSCAFVFVGALALCLLTGYVPISMTVTLALAGTVIFFFARTLKSGNARVASALVGLLIVVAGFAATSHYAKAQIEAVAREAAPDFHILDVAVSPFPADPLCWSAVVLETHGDQYSSRRATFALLPSVLGAGECPEMGGFGRGGARVHEKPVSTPSHARLLWEDGFEGKISDLRELAAKDRVSNALLRFLRFPVWRPDADGAMQLGDLRFNRGARAGLASMEVKIGESVCPPHVPGWDYPRADILGSAAGTGAGAVPGADNR